MNDFSGRPLNRREVLRGGVLLGAGALLGPGLLSACGTTSSGGSSTTSTAAATSSAAASSSAASSSTTASSAAGPLTYTKVSEFGPFKASTAVGGIPNLPKTVAYTVPEANDYFTQLSKAAEQGCKDGGVEYEGLIISNGDPVKNIDQINQLLQRGIGGLIIQPQDAVAQKEVILKAMDAGVCVWFSGAPSSIQGMADQYDLGYTQAVGAVEWIKANLGGSAKVVVFQGDQVEVLIPRGQGTLDGLATGAPGVEVVVSQNWDKQTTDEGFTYASTIYQAHPDVNVWIGPDDTVLGVDAFLKTQNLDPATSKILCTGLNGTPAGQAAVASGTSFVREVYGFSSTLVGYTAGAFCADWLNGREVAQVVQTRVRKLTNKAEVDAFNSDLADPKASYQRTRDGKEDSVKFWGNISYDTRTNYPSVIVTSGQ